MGEQQDSNEYLHFLLEGMHEEVKGANCKGMVEFC